MTRSKGGRNQHGSKGANGLLSSLPIWRERAAGKWTVQQAAELSVPAPTIEAALDGRFLSGLKDERLAAAKIFAEKGLHEPSQHKVGSYYCGTSLTCNLAAGTSIRLIKTIAGAWRSHPLLHPCSRCG